MTTKNAYRESFDREIARWDGVYVDWESGSKHTKAVLYVGTQTRMIFMSRGAKAGQGRGEQNARAELRKVLRQMGATERT